MLVRLGWMGTYVHTQHDDFDDVVGQGAIPIIHDQHIILSEARLAFDVGLTARFGASLMIPVRIVSTTIDYRDGMGNVVELSSPNIHHRDETLTGLGDPMVLGSYSLPLLTLRAGASVPLGRTEEDPFALGDMGLSHEHIQMGTGTINPVLSAEVSVPWKKWQFGGYALTQQVLYENSKGYQAGDRYAVGIGARRGFAGNWLLRAGVDMQAESSERWKGELHPEEGNQGRIDVMLSLGASWALTDRLSLDTAIKIPFITHVVGGQLDMPALAEVGVAWRFGAAREAHGDHDHEHGHDDDHDHEAHVHVDSGGADVVDVQPPGAAIDLVPVPGKLTIFEFGASWCEPCKTLEPVLVELAKSHPNVAVRRIDVVDWDSPVVARYLTPRAFDLPHVKVFDASGKLVFERSSAPGKLGALIDDVRALVEPTPPAEVPPAESPPAEVPPAEGPPVTVPPAPQSPTPTPTPPPAQGATEPVKPKPVVKPYRVEVVVTEAGFSPAEVKVPHGRPVTLVITRKTNKTCATDVAIEGQVKDLPLDKPVEIRLSFAKAGKVTYACSMNMIKGSIVVQ